MSVVIKADAVAVTDAVAVAVTVAVADGGTMMSPSTLKANCPEFALHAPLANLKLQGSAHGVARPSTGQVQTAPAAEVPHLMVDDEPETASA